MSPAPAARARNTSTATARLRDEPRLRARRREGVLTRAAAQAQLAEALRQSGVDDARREAQLLLRAASGLSAAEWLSSPEAPLDQPERAEELAARRLAGEPLSRIFGSREFWSLTLTLTPDVLDPRPETETLVEAALAAFATRREERLAVLDLGVGSGAILAALLSELPNALGVGVDASAEAAEVARKNLAALGLADRSEVVIGDWGEGLYLPSPEGRGAGGEGFERGGTVTSSPRVKTPHPCPSPSGRGESALDLIVSNPPYIPSAEIAALPREVRDYDPRLALDGGPDGLNAYRALSPHVERLLKPGGRVFVEIGFDQAERVKSILAAAGLAGFSIFCDLAGRERVVGGTRASPA